MLSKWSNSFRLIAISTNLRHNRGSVRGQNSRNDDHFHHISRGVLQTFQRNISQRCWAQHVARVSPPCCDVLSDVGSSLKMVKFSCNSCGCCMMLYSLDQVRTTMLHQGVHTGSIWSTQYVANVATPRSRVAKRVQHVVPNNFAIFCVEILARALEVGSS